MVNSTIEVDSAMRRKCLHVTLYRMFFYLEVLTYSVKILVTAEFIR